jgi:hypothetical protein
MFLGVTQPITKICTTKIIVWGKAGLERKADNLTAICVPVV